MRGEKDEFQLRLGRIGDERASNLARVRAGIAKSSWITRSSPRGRGAGKMSGAPTMMAATGRSAARLPDGPTSTRRVVVRAALSRPAVSHGGHALSSKARSGVLRAHVRYLERDGANARTLNEAEPAFYDRSTGDLDAKAITAEWGEDGAHYRLVISAEDGEELGDLKPFVRETILRLEARLGTSLDWLAVDHFDTDNPHSHVLIRARTGAGEPLEIPSGILRSAIRRDAEEIAARVLGPRNADDYAERDRERSAPRITPVDRALERMRQTEGCVSPATADQVARLEQLQTWNLARRTPRGWRLAGNYLGTLQAMEDRSALEATLFSRQEIARRPLLLWANARRATQGRLVHIGPASSDPDTSGCLVVLETAGGELRFARFEASDDILSLRQLASGSIVAFMPALREAHAVDRMIDHIAGQSDGQYSRADHLGVDPRAGRQQIEACLDQLGAMKALNLVSEAAPSVFLVGADHLKRGRLLASRMADARPLRIHVLSCLTLDQQVAADGPTWLDRVLAGEAPQETGKSPLALETARALERRREALVAKGWLRTSADPLSSLLLNRMAEVELRRTAQRLSAELAMPVRVDTLAETSTRKGRPVDLAQGRYVLVVGQRHARLVQWRPEGHQAGLQLNKAREPGGPGVTQMLARTPGDDLTRR